jgi:hypothetical protein
MSNASSDKTGAHAPLSRPAPPENGSHVNTQPPKAALPILGDETFIANRANLNDRKALVIALADTDNNISSIINLKVGQDDHVVVLQIHHEEMMRFVPQLRNQLQQPNTSGNDHELPYCDSKVSTS